jgi:hypothetical protein
MEKLNIQNIITGVAGTLLLGVSGWLLNTTLELQKDIVEVKIQNQNIIETLDEVYAENCPYCVHAAHSGIKEHPYLAPAIKQAHKHSKSGEVIFIND